MAALDGRVALVTGASSGIGAAVARSLCGAGATVVLAARREERLREVAARIREEGGRAEVAPADVADRSAVEDAVAGLLDRHGRIDIVVNNAGVMPVAPITSASVDDWTRMVDVNVKGVLHVLGAVLPAMVDRGSGHLVNIGSVAGRRPFPGGTVYAATKFAVRALSWGLHLELGAAHGIRVTDVQPGVVETELFDHIEDETIRERFRTEWTERRPLQPEDVARAVLQAVTAPEHVSVSEVLLRPLDQPT